VAAPTTITDTTIVDIWEREGRCIRGRAGSGRETAAMGGSSAVAVPTERVSASVVCGLGRCVGAAALLLG